MATTSLKNLKTTSQTNGQRAVSVLVLRGVSELFTYLAENSFNIGDHVIVPFGRTTVTGLIVADLDAQQLENAGTTTSPIKSAPSSTSVKPVPPLPSIKSVIEKAQKKPSVSKDLIAMIYWMVSTYQVTYYVAYQCIVGARKFRPVENVSMEIENYNDWPTLTTQQSDIFSSLKHKLLGTPTYDESLIHGVTGSGKTEIYLNLAREALEQKKSTIVLVPEIALTPQLSQAFTQRFGDCLTVLHSGLTPKQKDEAWNRINEQPYSLVLGPRSAIFSPVKQLGLIIIDEEHDNAYKQESSPRYHLLEVARFRAQFHKALIVKGSATPSLESYHGTEEIFEMMTRVHQTHMPHVHIIDLKEEEPAHRLFSKPLIDAMTDTLLNNKKIMILVNRRGFAPYISCQSCGQIHICPNCELSYTYHSDKSFRCHRCLKKTPVTHECTACKKKTLKFSGTGIQKIEYECRKLFPSKQIYRLDKDTGSTAKKIEKVLQSFRDDGDILIGTQMIAKGHHIENVHLVGILAIDNQLNIPDFRSVEKTFQLITQVAGRAGREKDQGEVYVQTSQPNHYVFGFAKHHDFKQFFQKETKYRKMLNYPPYSHLINIIFSSKSQKSLSIYLKDISKFFKTFESLEGVQVIGPAAAPVERINTYYRWHVLLKCMPDCYENIRKKLTQMPRIKYVRTIIDFDPVSIL